MSTDATVLERPAETQVTAPGGASMELPALVAGSGEHASRLTLEFFTARIANPHTREAYGRAVARFCAWCVDEGIRLSHIEPASIAAYYELLGQSLCVASIKLHASGIRHWLDYLTTKGVLPFNPALSVRTERLNVEDGLTPVLEREEAQVLFSLFEGKEDIVSLRDRAALSVMLFGFLRVSAACRMQVRHFEDEGREAFLVIHEKRGRKRRIPCHHLAREYLRIYVDAAGLDATPKAPLFQSAAGRSGRLTDSAMLRQNMWSMVKRRCRQAGLPSSICNHSFRATGGVFHQDNEGRLQDLQNLMGHESSRTTERYVRRSRKTARAEVERVQL